MKEIVDEWINEANEDLEAAKYNLKKYPKKAAYFAQQSVEKFLKAFLAFNNEKIPKIHEIEALIGKCSMIDKEFEKLFEIKAYILSRYHKTRYPPHIISVSVEEAKEAIEIAEKVKDFVIKKLKYG